MTTVEITELIQPKCGGSKKGIPKSEAHKRKIAESLKGKMTGSLHPLFGKHHSEESKAKMSENQKGRTAWNKGLIVEGPIVKWTKRYGNSIIVRLPRQWRDKIVKCSTIIAENIVVKKVMRNGNSGLVFVPNSWIGLQVKANIIENNEAITPQERAKGSHRSEETKHRMRFGTTKVSY